MITSFIKDKEEAVRITFDSNVWEKVVYPEGSARDPRQADFLAIREAVRDGRLQAYIAELFALLEAIPRRERPEYLGSRPSPVRVAEEQADGRTFSVTLELGGRPEGHPGLRPILSDRLLAALQLGFRVLPSTRFGMPRPAELNREEVRIPLTEAQRADVWPLLETISDTCDAIEARGVGFAALLQLAKGVQARFGIQDAPWFEGLDRVEDPIERKAIADAFGEWADGDSVALHVAYGNDVFCTEDFGRSGRPSVLSNENRTWLTDTYGVRFATVSELARSLEA